MKEKKKTQLFYRGLGKMLLAVMLLAVWMIGFGQGGLLAEPPSEPTPGLLITRQRELADKYQRLEEILLRMAELTSATDPDRASLLKKAIAQGEKQRIDTQFDALVELLEKDRLSRAIETQESVTLELEALLKLLLSENRADRLQSEKTRIRNYLKQLNDIIKRQKGLQGRTSGSGDPGQLADEQGSLADKTGGLAQQIEENESPRDDPDDRNEDASDNNRQDQEKGEDKNKNKDKDNQKDNGPNQENGKEPSESDSSQEPGQGGEGQQEGEGQQGEGKSQGKNQPQSEEQPAAKRLEAAQQRMREAREKLDEAQRAEAAEKQEEAIRELEQAKAELEEILRQFREEQIERMLTMLEERFRRMLVMQQDVYDGTLRRHKIPESNRDHNHEIECARLGAKQSEIVFEADKALALLREDGSAVAFPEAVGQMREDMEQVVRYLEQAKVGPITQAVEEDIIAALEEMLEALRQALEDLEDRRQSSSQPSPASTPEEPPLINLLEEIKMIRALQMRVNRRTTRYSELIEGEQAETADLLEALNQLAERQLRIYQVTRDLETGKNQ